MAIRNRDASSNFTASSKHPTQFASRISAPNNITLSRTSTLGQTLMSRTYQGNNYEIVDTTGSGTYSIYEHAEEVASFDMPFLGNQEEMWAIAQRAIDELPYED